MTAEPRLLLRVDEAKDMLGISRTAFYALLGAGQIQSVHIGRSVRVPLAALQEFVSELVFQKDRSY